MIHKKPKQTPPTKPNQDKGNGKGKGTKEPQKP